MKKLLALLLALMMILSLAACAKDEAPADDAADAPADAPADDAADAPADDAEGYKVGLCLPDLDQFWSTFDTYATKAAEENGIHVQTVQCKEDISTQLGQIETFANNGFDAVIVGLSNNDSYNEALSSAGDMKVVFFNRMVTDPSILDGEKCMYIGMSEYDAGLAQGNWLSEYFKAEGKTDLKGIMFMGVLGQDAVTNRTAGAKDALEANGFNVEWVFEDTAEWDRAKAMDKFTQFAGTGAEFDFVVANNDEMALGVVEACTATGREIDFPIVGIDATETGCMAIKEGTMQMTVNQNAPLQGAEAINSVIALLNGELPEGCDPETFIFNTDAQAITIDNADEVLAIFGH